MLTRRPRTCALTSLSLSFPVYLCSLPHSVAIITLPLPQKREDGKTLCKQKRNIKIWYTSVSLYLEVLRGPSQYCLSISNDVNIGF